MLPLKLLDPLPDQVNDLPIRRTPIVLGNIMQLVVQLAVDAESKVLIFFLFGEFHLAAAPFIYLFQKQIEFKKST